MALVIEGTIANYVSQILNLRNDYGSGVNFDSNIHDIFMKLHRSTTTIPLRICTMEHLSTLFQLMIYM